MLQRLAFQLYDLIGCIGFNVDILLGDQPFQNIVVEFVVGVQRYSFVAAVQPIS